MAKVVLLIEDEKDIRTIYAELLKDSGYEVLEAADGDAGLEIATNSYWDLLLLDVMLPKKDGLEVLSKIKVNETIKERPVVLLSNLEKSDVLKACMDLGARNYLIKSNIVPQDLIDEVGRQLQGSSNEESPVTYSA